MVDKLIELAARCESATGPDRELDLEICLATLVVLQKLDPSKITDLVADKDDAGWVLYSYEGMDCTDEVMAFTGSIDAALSLVPEGWFWRCGRTSAFQAWAGVNRLHPDHCDKSDESFARREYWEPTWTPVLALVSASLRARAAQHADDRSSGRSPAARMSVTWPGAAILSEQRGHNERRLAAAVGLPDLQQQVPGRRGEARPRLSFLRPVALPALR
jgi:hypothetical protein